ncbi:YwqG family protein [Stenotrophomonas maltophilia]|nr:YwqG family protein [Stenotrophomonas sp. GD03937]MDH1275802.1 YwqG family protein [Stenotrophomonas sp. GD03937]
MDIAPPWFADLCAQHGLAAQADALSSLLRPCLAFAPAATDPPMLGASRKGGGPDVPEGFAWPVHRGRALDFLLQINLADLADAPSGLDLPSTGVLSFFYDMDEQPWGYEPEHRTGHRVFLFNADELVRRLPAADEAFALVPSALVFHPGLRLPQLESAEGARVGGWMTEQGLGWDERCEDAYFELVDAVAAHHAGRAKPLHAVGGHAHSIQGDMQLEAQLVTHGLSCGDGTAYSDPRRPAWEQDRGQWQLLLQLDSADNDAMWGDSGMLYFWIRRQDLAARDLSQTWMALQCC